MLTVVARLLPVFLGLAAALSPIASGAAPDAAWQVFAPVRSAPVLYQPSGVAVDPAGHILVTDATAGNVQKLSSRGQPLAVWNGGGSGTDGIARPSGIARGSNGELYVADPGNTRVDELSPGGTLVRAWTVPGLSADTATITTGMNTGNALVVNLSSQLAITVGPGGNVFTLQPTARTRFTVRRFSATGTLQRSWTVALHTRLETTFPEKQGLNYLVTPLGIAIAPNGTQFVALEDQVCSISRNNRCRSYEILQKRSANGVWQREWTIAQTASLGPQATTGLAVDRQGHLLVPAPQNNAIYLYSPFGEYVDTWKPAASGAGDYSDISGIAATPYGNVFVVGAMSRAVQKLNATGHRLTIWGKQQSDIFSYPGRLAVDPHGTVYLAVHGHLKKIRPNGTTAATWPVPNGPDGVAVGPNGDIYVTDLKGVMEFSPGGRVVRSWGATGTGPGQFRGAAGIAADASGNIYVADTFNHRVQEFTATGTFMRQWGSRGPGEGQFENPVDVAVAPSGNIYVADQSGDGRIEEFAPDGTFVAQWRVPLAPWDPAILGNYPTGVAVDAAGNIFTAYGYDAVVQIVPNGAPRFWGGWGILPGQFQNAGGLALDGSGNLYVSDGPIYLRNARVQKINVGEPV